MTETTTQALERYDGSPRALVQQYQDSFAQVLPSHITRPETWVRLAQGALKKGKRVQDGRTELEVAAGNNPGVFLATLLDCARLGLEPGTEQYYLTPRRVKVNGAYRTEILGIVGYQGHIELMYRAGAISSVVAECVYERDKFRFSPGRDEIPVHEIDWDADDRGKLRLVYAFARMKDGATSRVVVLNRAAISQIKKSAQGADSPYSPWQTAESAMWLKSAVRQLAKWVPTSSEYIREQLRAARDVATEHAPQPNLGLPDLPHVDSETGEIHDIDDDEIAEAELLDPDDEPETATPTSGGEGDGITDAQSRALHALLRKRHNAIGPDRHKVLTHLLGREITSTKDVTKAEASELIDLMQDEINADMTEEEG